jgi:hypothetical protein
LRRRAEKIPLPVKSEHVQGYIPIRPESFFIGTGVYLSPDYPMSFNLPAGLPMTTP